MKEKFKVEFLKEDPEFAVMIDRIKSETSASRFWPRFASDQAGATAIEYALIAGGISIVIVASVNGVGSEVVNLFTAVRNSF